MEFCETFCVSTFNVVISIIVIISYPLYVSVVIVLIKCRHVLSASFFKLCISVGLADLIYLTCRTFFRRITPIIWNVFPGSVDIINSTVSNGRDGEGNLWPIYIYAIFYLNRQCASSVE